MKVAKSGEKYGHVSWKTYLEYLDSVPKIQIRRDGNPRRQSPFGIRRFALIDLCLLCSLELGLELVTQSE
jgi:hypothetical protein